MQPSTANMRSQFVLQLLIPTKEKVKLNKRKGQAQTKETANRNPAENVSDFPEIH
jgi:hypothetical protein